MVASNLISEEDTLRVVELFAGVGGFRLGLEGWDGMSAGSGYTMPLRDGDDRYRVVWSNQWEPSTKRQHANEVYEARWGSEHHCGDDISTVPTEAIPDHDVLVGGFPCQDYSVATTLRNSKGLRGRKGVLWWQIERILREKGDKAPRYLFLENVDRLLQSPAGQRGRDFAIMLASLSDLGYAVEWRVVNAADYGMPQKRKRVFFLGYKKGTPEHQAIENLKVRDMWIEEGLFAQAFPIGSTQGASLYEGKLKGSLTTLSKKFNAGPTGKLSPFCNAGIMFDREFSTMRVKPAWDEEKMLLGDVLQPLRQVPKEYRIDKDDLPKWKYLKGAKREPRESSRGYSYMFAEGALSFPDALDSPSRTIITGEGGKAPSRTKHAIRQGRTLRRLTPVELERLNMFPDNHTALEDIPDGKRAFFMGNALVVGVIERVGSVLLERIGESKGVLG